MFRCVRGICLCVFRTCGGAALYLYVGAQGDVSGAARLQGDGVGMEVSQHVRYGMEPQVVHVALPILIHRQTQMLEGGEGGGKVCESNVKGYKEEKMESKGR